MAKRRRKNGNPGPQVQDYRHDAKRKNNPPAGLAAQGRVAERPKIRYEYDPHLPPRLRFDQTGKEDELPQLLHEATRRPLTEDEARELAEGLRHREPWLEWSGKREAKWFEVEGEAFEKFSGTRSLPFPMGKNKRCAVKVIDPRGNEVIAVRRLDGTYGIGEET